MNDNVLPDLKVGNVLTKTGADGRCTTFQVYRVGKGKAFDEPVYFLQGTSGVKMRTPYAGEELAELGYRLQAEGLAT